MVGIIGVGTIGAGILIGILTLVMVVTVIIILGMDIILLIMEVTTVILTIMEVITIQEIIIREVEPMPLPEEMVSKILITEVLTIE